MTTADYLEQLQQDREDLVDNLETQGITGLTGNETFTELVPEVLNIQTGIESSDLGRTTTRTTSQSFYAWPDLVNKLYVKAFPSDAVTFANFLGDEIIFDDNFANTGTYSFNFKQLANLKKVTNLSLKNNSSGVSFEKVFQNLSNLEEITFGTMDITYLYHMGAMFDGCSKLKEFDASGWNATTSSGGVNLGWAFYNNTAIKKIDLSGITGNVAELRQAFQSCSSLEEVNLSNLNNFGSSATTLQTFYRCPNITKIDIRNLPLHNLSSSSSIYMFGIDATDGPPDDCLVIVKDQTEKTWVETNFPRLTNVQTVAEYEAE